jgi:hypothetical protein
VHEPLDLAWRDRPTVDTTGPDEGCGDLADAVETTPDQRVAVDSFELAQHPLVAQRSRCGRNRSSVRS